MNKQFASCAACLAVVVAVVGAQTPPPVLPDQFYQRFGPTTTRRSRLCCGHGAAVDVEDRRGGATPLMNASAFGSFETMKLLIDKGADVNAGAAAGATALMRAVTPISRKCVCSSNRGADVNAASESGRTALLLAAMSDRSGRDRPAAAVAWRERPGRRRRQNDDVVGNLGNDSETIAQLVAAGVNVNLANVLGTTPLMNAASEGNLDAARQNQVGVMHRIESAAVNADLLQFNKEGIGCARP